MGGPSKRRTQARRLADPALTAKRVAFATSYTKHARGIQPLALDRGFICLECGSPIARTFGRWHHAVRPFGPTQRAC